MLVAATAASGVDRWGVGVFAHRRNEASRATIRLQSGSADDHYIKTRHRATFRAEDGARIKVLRQAKLVTKRQLVVCLVSSGQCAP